VDDSSLHFNIAHSGRRILISLSPDGEVGVDLEVEQPGIEVLDLARFCFHPEEQAHLDSQSSATGRLHAFYRCWTRKEAIVKADGRGLSLPLESFSVAPVIEGEREVLISAPDRVASLWVREIHTGSGYAAAFATCKPGIKMECFDLSQLG
jgi:4'-phosphopantetheinyl transferase